MDIFKQMRMPGVEPGSQAWEACMIPLHYMRLALHEVACRRVRNDTSCVIEDEDTARLLAGGGQCISKSVCRWTPQKNEMPGPGIEPETFRSAV